MDGLAAGARSIPKKFLSPECPPPGRISKSRKREEDGGEAATTPQRSGAATSNAQRDRDAVLSPRSRACGTAVFVLLRTKCARWISPNVATFGHAPPRPDRHESRLVPRLASGIAGIFTVLTDYHVKDLDYRSLRSRGNKTFFNHKEHRDHKEMNRNTYGCEHPFSCALCG
jgi:hypothetical protein